MFNDFLEIVETLEVLPRKDPFLNDPLFHSRKRFVVCFLAPT